MDLPPSNSFDNIFVVVDWLTKMAYFIPYKKTSSSEDTTRFFLNNVYRYHGVRDTKYRLEIWTGNSEGTGKN